MAGISNLFGISVTAANVRADNIGFTYLRESISIAMAVGFGQDSSIGSNAYQSIKGNPLLGETSGFDSISHYNLYEEQIYQIIDNYLPNELVNNKKILALVVNAIIFSYYVHADVNINDIVNLIGQVLVSVAGRVNNNQVFQVQTVGTISTVIQPFDSVTVETLVSNDYSFVINEINSSPKDSKVRLVNYNWYDTTTLFASPNLQIMKDVENQYYYISGNLIYQSSGQSLPQCQTQTLTIITPTGNIVTEYILNQPCINSADYIGPVSGVTFYREFNDGPSSIGDFNASVKQAYINFDKAVLKTGDYSSNAYQLFSFDTDASGNYLPLTSGEVFIDGNGLYNLEGIEYGSTQSDARCVGYQRMHIGDNRPRLFEVVDIHNNCIGSYTGNVTGFKFVGIGLDDIQWFDEFAYMNTNPVVDSTRFFTRALNMNSSPYYSVPNGDFLKTMTNSDVRYIGYPQLSGGNTLPFFAFFQEFDSSTFGDKIRLSIYAAVGSSFGNDGSGSDRSYIISSSPIFSGTNNSFFPFDEGINAILPFSQLITSNYQTGDNILKQVMGMGDNFGNQYTVITAQCSNAGYSYISYVFSGASGIVNPINLLPSYQNDILGSTVQNIQYISGYMDTGTQQIYSIEQIYAQFSGGDKIPYYYFDNRSLPPQLQSPNNNWDIFAPVPTGFQTSQYQEITGIQQIENFFPRYSEGPFSVEKTTFLYPNASGADQIYSSKTNGFPRRIKYTLSVREEAVKELYGRYYITPEGEINTSINYIRVVRAGSDNTVQYNDNNPVLKNIFDDANVFTFNFNNFSNTGNFTYNAQLGLVANNWAPTTTSSYASSGKTTSVYNGGNISDFTQGVKLTGIGNDQWLIHTGTGISDTYVQIVSQYNPDGLYHYYKTYQETGEMIYQDPIFNLETNNIYINEAIQDSFSIMCNNNYNKDCSRFNDDCSPVDGCLVLNFDGSSEYITSGDDPIFIEYMGGRSGGNAQVEGSYHSEGLIGDQWTHFSFGEYGLKAQTFGCNGGDGTPPCRPCASGMRWTTRDNRLIVLTADTNTTSIFTRAMQLSPFSLPDQPFIPFRGNESYNISGGAGSLTLNYSGRYASFNLNNYFPMKIGASGWYSSSGLTIGPFDRDIEVGMWNANFIAPSGDMYLDGIPYTSYSDSACTPESLIFNGVQDNSGIFTNQYGRSNLYTVIKLIPVGQTININVSGRTDLFSGIGFNPEAIISLRPRYTIGLSQYISSIEGEEFYCNPFNFLGMGMEQVFDLPTNGAFENLDGQTFTFLNYSRSGILYPKPSDDDFRNLSYTDAFGNILYPTTGTVENYWKAWAAKNRQGMYVSGWREGSRISFQLTNIEVEYDELPYEKQTVVIPSGACLISGAMGYAGQAEASIFSEGIFLTDVTPATDDPNEYSPYFVSDVIRRVPFLDIPSGTAYRPVLSAPSVMLQRTEVSVISEEQTYNKLLNYSPDNYNKLLWPALSDLETLNPQETIEETPPDDGNTYGNSTMIFSASQGQLLPNGKTNPNINKQFDVTKEYQMYDSLATDAVINSGQCITQVRGTNVRLNQNSNLSGILAAADTTLSMVGHSLA